MPAGTRPLQHPSLTMASDETLPTLKFLLIGPSGAGKSALLTRYCDDEYDPESSTATIGIDFKIKKLAIRGKAFRLTLFDTAGQERFRTLSTSFYRGAHGVLLVYDISSRASFLSMERWFDEATSNTLEGVALYLVCKGCVDQASFSPAAAESHVGAKLDKAETGGRAVSTDEGKKLADAYGAGFCEASAKTRQNVRRPFVELVDQVFKMPGLLAGASGGSSKSPGALLVNGGGGGALASGNSSCSC